MKGIHVKPSLYAHYFYYLKDMAARYGYNLVLHGSMSRDLDLIAIPWCDITGNSDDMIKDMADYLGGEILEAGNKKKLPSGRVTYIININRGPDFSPDDPQYYLDISVIKPQKK